MPIPSNAPLFIELVFISAGQEVSVPAHNYVQAGTYVELTSAGSWTGQLVLYDHESDALESLILAAGNSRTVRLTFGRGPEYPGETVRLVGQVTVYQPTFEPGGVGLTLELVAAPAMTAALDRRILSFASGRRVSDIVEEIATQRGWSLVDNVGRATVETTPALVSEPFNSEGESDFAFIEKALRPQAINAGGVGGYVFYVDETNAVHFHTPEFLPRAKHSYTYARDPAGEVSSFTITDLASFGAFMGGGNSLFGGVSSVAGAAAEVESDTAEGVDGVGSPIVSDASSKPNLGDGTHAYINLVTRDIEELRRLARARYDEFRRYTYRATMDVVGTNRARVLDYIDFRYVKQQASPGSPPDHYLSGLFQIFKIRHELGPAWTTQYEMLRGGLNTDTGLSVATTEVLEPVEPADDTDTVSLLVETTG